MEALPLIVWYLDDPVADPALVPLWFIAREARRHVKVVLSGEGADELFGGYTIYREPLSLAAFEKVPAGAAPGDGLAVDQDPRGHPRQGPAAPRVRSTWSSATTATPASSATTSCARCCAPSTSGSATWT